MFKWLAWAALPSDWAISPKFQALSIMYRGVLPKQFKAEKAKFKYELEVLRFFSTLRNERL